MEKEIFRRLPDALLPWYAENKRILPWREISDPYCVWVSEIMLQQTRVEAVKGYYNRFVKVLPTVSHLATADDELLYKLWEGLGYYSRVRNMKKAAQLIMEKHNGKFPDKYADVIALPGVGPYTAGAICSIAFGLNTPAVDGNVLRVVSRLLNDFTPVDSQDFKKRVSQGLQEVYPGEAGTFTQALMELGATVCGPNRKPDCTACPCSSFCGGFRAGTTDQLPVKIPKRSRHMEDKTVVILRCGDCYALDKRPDKGLLSGMWQFPNVPGRLDLDGVLSVVKDMDLRVIEVSLIVERKHIFTHVQWNMTGVYLEVAERCDNFVWMTAEQINTDACLPTAFRLFWDELSKI